MNDMAVRRRTVEELADRNPFKNAVEGGREIREVAMRIAEVALPEMVEGQIAAAQRMNDLLVRDGFEKVARVDEMLDMTPDQTVLSTRQMAEAIADPSTLFALSEASDHVEEILMATGIEGKMRMAFNLLREAGVDVSGFQGVVHESVRDWMRKVALTAMKKKEEPRYTELLALMDLSYNRISASVIKSALVYGVKATADSRATIALSEQRVLSLLKTAEKLEKLLSDSRRMREEYEKVALPVGEIMERAGTVSLGRENGLVRPDELNIIVETLQGDVRRLKGGKSVGMGLKKFDVLTDKYLGDGPSQIEEASQAIAGSYSMKVATSANARMMIGKALSYYSLAAAEAQRMLMTHETLTMVMNFAICKLNRSQRDEAMAVISQMVRLINQGQYEQAFVLGAQRKVLPEEYTKMKLEVLGEVKQ